MANKKITNNDNNILPREIPPSLFKIRLEQNKDESSIGAV